MCILFSSLPRLPEACLQNRSKTRDSLSLRLSQRGWTDPIAAGISYSRVLKLKEESPTCTPSFLPRIPFCVYAAGGLDNSEMGKKSIFIEMRKLESFSYDKTKKITAFMPKWQLIRILPLLLLQILIS